MISLSRFFMLSPAVRMKVEPPTAVKERFKMATTSRSSLCMSTCQVHVFSRVKVRLCSTIRAVSRSVACGVEIPGALTNRTGLNTGLHSTTLDRNARIVGSSHGWFLLLETSDCSLSLKKSSSTGENISLPPIETLPDFTGKVYRERDVDCKPGFPRYEVAGFTYQGQDGKEGFETSETLSENFVNKAFLTSYPTSEDCTVVITTPSAKSKLAYCQPGDLKWRTLDSDCCSDSVVYNNMDNKFYAIRNKTKLEIEIWDLKDPSNPQKTIHNPLSTPSSSRVDSYRRTESSNCYIKSYLVESRGNIFLVARHYTYEPDREVPYWTFWFDVMKLNKNGRRVEVVTCLDDQAFFLDIDPYSALSTFVFSEAEPNTIYFGDHNTNRFRKGKEEHDFGRFNMENNSIKSCNPTESIDFPYPLLV